MNQPPPNTANNQSFTPQTLIGLGIVFVGIIMCAGIMNGGRSRSSNYSTGGYRAPAQNNWRIQPQYPQYTSPDDVYVQPYSRQDGTQVGEHMRSAPDSTRRNNWSTYPNVNPYTGEYGDRRGY